MRGPYFADSSTKIVHDLNLATKECMIGQVEIKNKKYFVPDTLEQAHKEGYVNCKYCLSDSN